MCAGAIFVLYMIGFVMWTTRSVNKVIYSKNFVYLTKKLMKRTNHVNVSVSIIHLSSIRLSIRSVNHNLTQGN